METSDSEHFESADEEFMSDEEEASVATTKNVVKPSSEISIKDTKVLNTSKTTEDETKAIKDVADLSEHIENIAIKCDNNKKLPDEDPEIVGKRYEAGDAPLEKTSTVDSKKKEISRLISKYMTYDDEPASTQSDSSIKSKTKSTNIGSTSNKHRVKEDKNKENQLSKDDTSCSNNPIKPALGIEDNKNIDVDDMWGNDDWGNEEILDPITEVKPKETSPNEQEQLEEDMWGDDEDWGEPKPSTKVDYSGFVEPPMITQCWEPGMNYKIEDEVEKEDLWKDDDDWEPINNATIKKSEEPKVAAQALDSLVKENEGSSWGGWSSWGLSSVLSTATASVSTLTNHVTQGISTVLESGMGVPDPVELARQHKEELESIKEKHSECTDDNNSISNIGLGIGLGNLVSGVSQITKLVEKTGTKVISGGLDTLETIGKKTMEVLQENDPGLKRKRAFLKIDSDKPILSQLLREAKEKAEEENKASEQRHQCKKPNYETIFDDYQGLVHLEALEMLSKQCDIKLQTLSNNMTGNTLTEMQETMDQVKELCELPEEEEEETLDISDVRERLKSIVLEVNIPIRYNGLLETWEQVEDWLEKVDLNICDENKMHKQAIESLAHLTAISVEQYHKAGELLLVKEHRSTADEADGLVQLTTTLTTLIGNVASKLSKKLTEISNHSNNKDAVNELITNVFFEAANSSSYIQDAFQLLIPVLQVGAV